MIEFTEMTEMTKWPEMTEMTVIIKRTKMSLNSRTQLNERKGFVGRLLAHPLLQMLGHQLLKPLFPNHCYQQLQECQSM